MKFIISAIISLMVFSCHHASQKKFYGESFDTTHVITVAELLNKMPGSSRVNAVVEGKISSSCEDDGCWLELENTAGSPVHVDWNEEFHLPASLEGKKVKMSGYAFIDSTQKQNPVAFKASGVILYPLN